MSRAAARLRMRAPDLCPHDAMSTPPARDDDPGRLSPVFARAPGPPRFPDDESTRPAWAAAADAADAAGTVPTGAATAGEAPATGPDAAGQALAPGTRLAEFEIRGLVGQGGFGIVYVAHDHSLQRRVALKEYMPASLARRAGALAVEVGASRQADAFEAGLRSFVNEARLLARFDHPALVKVYRFWEANGTAYMVMPLYEGITLREALRGPHRQPDEDWLRALLAPLLQALGVLHAQHCCHRDIAPDNILLQPDGRPVLLDFGAARRVIRDMTHAPTVILKPGYAPIEQYAETGSLVQGPWTDVYALGAVLHFAITGCAPPASVARVVGDTLEPLSRRARGRFRASFLEAIDQALSIRPSDRPQSVAAFAHALGVPMEPRTGPPAARGQAAAGNDARAPLDSRTARPRHEDRDVREPSAAPPSWPPGPAGGSAARPGGPTPARVTRWIGAGGLLAAAALMGWLLAARESAPPVGSPQSPRPVSGPQAPDPAPIARPPAAQRLSDPAITPPLPGPTLAPQPPNPMSGLQPPNPMSAPQPPGPAIAAPAPAPIEPGQPPGPSTGPALQPPPATSQPKPPAPVRPPAPAVEPDPLALLDQVFAARDPLHHVEAQAPRARVRIGRDALRFTVRASEPGFVYLFVVDTERRRLQVLFPNPLDADNRIAPGKALDLPRRGWEMVAEGPPGTDHFVAMVSRHPREFARADPADPRSTDPPPQAGAEPDGAWPPQAGRVVCPRAQPRCSPAYGAARFTIEEIGPTRAPPAP